MTDLSRYLDLKRNIINDALDNALSNSHYSSRLLKAMRYSLMSNGKRLRPVLCLSACETVGGDTNMAVFAACAIEMIHTYSLIHDDLPAMDNDTLRRGNPTCHIQFDEATAILAGDALLTLAFELLSSIQMSHTKNNDFLIKHFSIINAICKASGYKGMIEGQMRDMLSENCVLSLQELEDMHALKTGALIETSIQSGAVLGGGTKKQIEYLNVYAKKIGLAFQIADDVLNVEGDPLIMGKTSGTDAIRNKNTYPSMLGLDRSKEYMNELVNTALKSLEAFDEHADPLREIARYVVHRNR
jgi:geranylgeranyl diphosphate synthase type II